MSYARFLGENGTSSRGSHVIPDFTINSYSTYKRKPGALSYEITWRSFALLGAFLTTRLTTALLAVPGLVRIPVRASTIALPSFVFCHWYPPFWEIYFMVTSILYPIYILKIPPLFASKVLFYCHPYG